MSDDSRILPRHMLEELKEGLQVSRIVNLVGPRQVGKTTLVRDQYGEGEFLTLDDEAVLSALETDATGLLAAKCKNLRNNPLIIDEVQRSNSLTLAIKRIVDQNRRFGQFLLTGSSNVFSTAKAVDSLAGRVLTLKLWPLTVAETKEQNPPKILDWALQTSLQIADLPKPEQTSREDYIDLILAGGYPEMRELPLRVSTTAISILCGFCN